MSRSELLQSIANTVGDYRKGEIETPTPGHIEKWIHQFDGDIQNRLLVEVEHVLKNTYISKKIVLEFLSSLVKNKKIAGEDTSLYWKTSNFLNIQQGGQSQKDMLQIFDEVLRTICGIDVKKCGSSTGDYIYLDDALFTGARARGDLTNWIQSNAPSKATVHVIVLAIYEGSYWIDGEIKQTAEKASKNIDIHWWRCVQLENRKRYRDQSDVLWPTTLPTDSLTQEYVEMLQKANFPPILRQPGCKSKNEIFSSEEGRNLLEQEMLKAGLKIRAICKNLPEIARPLGFTNLKTLGFGATIVTYRNCPNNCPLAFWAGDPWHPLFPRKTNTDSEAERIITAIKQLRDRNKRG